MRSINSGRASMTQESIADTILFSFLFILLTSGFSTVCAQDDQRSVYLKKQGDQWVKTIKSEAGLWLVDTNTEPPATVRQPVLDLKTADTFALGIEYSLMETPSLFLPYVNLAVGSWPEAVAIGDVNNDGRNDVVLTTGYYFDPENDDHIFVFLQQSDGQFGIPAKYAASGTPETVDVADINGDGLQDVVVGNKNENIEVFMQNAVGTLTHDRVYPTPNAHKIRIGDLNSDGLNDIVGIGWNSNEADVFLQSPDGSLAFADRHFIEYGGYNDLQVGDVNGDGKADIVVMSGQLYAIDNVSVLLQNDVGAFDPAVSYDLGIDVNSSGVAIGDVNGDQLNDITVSYGGNSPSSMVGTFYQNGNETLDPPFSRGAYDVPESVQITDINSDGRDDLIVLHGGWQQAGVYLQTSDGNLASEQLYPIPYASHYNPHGLATGDINGDGLPDIAIADYNAGLVLLYRAPNAVNTPPAADAGRDQTVQPGSTVWLDGSGSSDDDGDGITFAWGLTIPTGSSAVLSGSNTVTPSFVADVAGTYVAELRVNDGMVDSELNSVSIVVNTPPSADAGANQMVLPGTEAILDGSGSSDADGDALSFTWTLASSPAGSNAMLINPDTAQPRLAPDVSGSYTARLIVNDGKEDSAPATVTVSVNQPPVADAGQDQTVKQNTVVRLSGSSSNDPDGVIVGSVWEQISGPAVLLSLASPDTTFTAPKLKGRQSIVLTFKLTVIDDEGVTATDSVVVTVVKRL